MSWREREREVQTDSTLSTEPNTGLDPQLEGHDLSQDQKLAI